MPYGNPRQISQVATETCASCPRGSYPADYHFQVQQNNSTECRSVSFVSQNPLYLNLYLYLYLPYTWSVIYERKCACTYLHIWPYNIECKINTILCLTVVRVFTTRRIRHRFSQRCGSVGRRAHRGPLAASRSGEHPAKSVRRDIIRLFASTTRLGSRSTGSHW